MEQGALRAKYPLGVQSNRRASSSLTEHDFSSTMTYSTRATIRHRKSLYTLVPKHPHIGSQLEFAQNRKTK